MKKSKIIRFVYPVLIILIIFTVICAIVMASNPNTKGFIGFMGSPLGIILFAIIPNLLILLHFVFHVFKRLREDAASMGGGQLSKELNILQLTINEQDDMIKNLEAEMKALVDEKGKLQMDVFAAEATREASIERLNAKINDKNNAIRKLDAERSKLQEENKIAIAANLELGAKSKNKIMITPGENPRPKATAADVISEIEELRAKPRVTAKMVIKPAHKLEKMRNKAEYKDDVELQKKIRTTLNWCYKILGTVQYDEQTGAKVPTPKQSAEKKTTVPKPTEVKDAPATEKKPSAKKEPAPKPADDKKDGDSNKS